MVALALSAIGAAGAQPQENGGGGLLGFGSLGKSKEPITVISDNLEYDYKEGIVVYRGAVQVTQGDVKLTSDVMTITLVNDKQQPGKRGKTDQDPNGAAADPAGDAPAAPAPSSAPSTDAGRVQQIVATGNVHIDQGTRWAVGGRATFDQSQRTLVLTENPVLHDGPNEVVGERVVVFLDEDRSVVEGGQKRVKAVLYPNDNKPNAAQAKAAPTTPAAPARRKKR